MSRALKLSLVTAGAASVAFLVGFGVFATAILHYDKGMPTAGDAVVVLTGGELRVREGFRLFTAGDSGALAAILAELAAHPAALARLRGGVTSPPSMAEHVHAVEAAYEAACAPRTGAEGASWISG